MPAARIRNFLAGQRLTVLGGLFVVAGSSVAYGDSGFPFLSVEFAALLGLAALAALFLAVPFAFRPGGRATVFAIGFTFFLDVAYFDRSWVVVVATVLLAAYLTYLIAWRNSDTVVPFAATVVAVSVVFILPQQALTNAHLTPSKIEPATAGPEAKGRPYVHIILDEMGSLRLMPKGPYYDQLRKRMVADYRKRGFDLFEDTTSSAGITIVSLGQVFADHDGEMHNFTWTRDDFTYTMNQNRAIDGLADAGYAVTMLQSSYLGMCRSDRWRCLTYASSGNGAELMRRSSSSADAVSYALRTTNSLLLLNDSSRSSLYYQLAGALASRLGMVVPEWRLYYTQPPQIVTLMEEVAKGLRKLDKGEAVFLHLLVPHFPYMLDEQCRVKAPDRAFAPKWAMEHLGIKFDLAVVQRAYWEQAACAHKKLMTMIDAILQSPGGKDAVILVHGDHGSRLLKKLIYPKKEPASEIERRYALLAHFAVRGLGGRHDELAAHHTLRERVSIVLNAVLGDSPPDPDLITSSMH